VQNFIGSSIVELVQLIILLVGALTIMFTANWQLTLIAVLPIVPMMFMTYEFGNRITALFFKVDTLLGDATKARTRLGWQPRTSFAELVAEMVREDLKGAERDELCRREGFQTFNHHE
jgi:ABC-type multidrug transport system fused ATPase/permease subunit